MTVAACQDKVVGFPSYVILSIGAAGLSLLVRLVKSSKWWMFR